MKKLIIILGVVLVILLGALVLVPVIFKDDIRAAVDQTLAESINADIVWDTNDFDLSLFTHFPNATAEIRNFGIVNKAPFEGQILFAVETFEVEIDIFSLFEEQIVINGIQLIRPEINIKVLEDGTANYDIAVASGEEEVEEEEPASAETTKFNVGINHWSISEGKVIYEDETLPFKMEISNLQHSGNGDFNQDVFDIATLTDAGSVSMSFDGVEYLTDKRFVSDVVMSISDNYSRYTFKENNVALNEFNLGFDGYFLMKEDEYEMDITYASKDNDFKSLLSLVPGAYLEGFEAVKTAGSLSFGGVVNGVYNDNRMPAFNLTLEVVDAMFQYPDLPTSATDINIKTYINNPDGVIDNTTVDVSQFHVNLGGNPFDATLKVSELNDIKWDLKASGKIDMDNVSKIMPMEGISLAGIINLNLDTKGQLSLIETEQYDKLPTSGSLEITKFKYTDETLPYDVAINKTSASFNPKEIRLSTFDAQIGNSDMQMNGLIGNYIGYVLDEKQVLAGTVNFTSSNLDIDEFMEEETSDEAVAEPVAAEDTSSLEVIPIPENIDFKLTTKIQKVKMTDMILDNVSGDIIIKDGVANLSGLTFNTLGGQFVVSGSYNAKDIENPAYDLKLDIKGMSISKSYEAFSTVQKYVPLAKNMTGDLSTQFEISGLLEKDMMPKYESINAAGLLNIAQAALDKPKFVNDISSLTKIAKLGGDNSDKVTLKDVLMSATIENGNLSVEPFDINIGTYSANVAGTTSVSGALDYKLDMSIPAGAIGSQVNSFLNKYTGSTNTSSTINLPIGVGGTITEPTYKLLASDTKVEVKDIAKAVVKEAVEKELGVDLEAEKEKQRQKIMSTAQKQADNVIAEGKSAADKVRKEGYAQADNLIKQAGSNILKKKVAEKSAQKLREETDKKAQKIEDESKAKANEILAKAREKADAV